jgi:hypothetical protein
MARRRKSYLAYMESETYKKIRQDLLDQLDRNSTLGEYYVNLVGDYMELWISKCLLIDDIARRGVTIKYNNGGGQSGMKKNDSVDLLIRVNGQMLKLLSELGIKWLLEPPSTPSPQSGGEPDDDPL